MHLLPGIAAGLLLVCLYPVQTLLAEAFDEIPWVHGISIYGDLKYPAGFEHFDYADPSAPKGGQVRRAGIAPGFDSFNPYNTVGQAAPGIGNIYNTLMVRAGDEAFSQYGQIAKYVKLPESREWVAFRIDPEARWHDGTPITPEDVIWTFNALVQKGKPNYRFYYADVDRVEKIGPRDVKFSFKSGTNRELPMIVGEMVVLPRHYWKNRDFSKTTLEPPLGSGPYRIDRFEANRFVSYRRVKNYWGADRPVARGRYNFDEIRYDLYSDSTIALEALKAGEYDIREENTAKHWAFGYDGPAVDKGQLIKKEFPDKTAHGLQGMFFNQRRERFQDPLVRRALIASFDFEWTNTAYFYRQYHRARSYFNASEMEAKGIPAGRELEILEAFRGRIPEEIFTTEYNPPRANRENGLRENLLAAARLLEKAGWIIDPDDLRLKNRETGEIFSLEFMVSSTAMQRVVLPTLVNLKRLGIEASVRFVDSAQYIERFRKRDYDAMVMNYGQSMSPGNEQRGYWGSDAADQNGSYNVAGVKNDVVDALIELLVAAPDREELVMRVRALDRVLQWLHLAIPHYYIPNNRVAYWNRFGIPDNAPTDGMDFFSWWIDPVLDEKLALRRNRQRPAVMTEGH